MWSLLTLVLAVLVIGAIRARGSAGHERWLDKELPRYVRDGALSEEAAGSLSAYLASLRKSPREWLLTAFSILGALLIGGGIILIFAYNWDQFGRGARAVISMLPLVFALALGGVAFFKKPQSVPWREGASTGIVAALAAAIALIGQTYHYPGNLESFLFTCSLLTLPVMYLFRGVMSGALYLIGVTGWCIARKVYGGEVYGYWLLLAVSLPWVYWVKLTTDREDLIKGLKALYAVLLMFALFVTTHFVESLGGPLFAATVFSCFYLMEAFGPSADRLLRDRPFASLGVLGTILMVYAGTYEDYWLWLTSKNLFLMRGSSWATAFEYTVLGLILLGAVIGYVRAWMEKRPLSILWGSAFIVNWLLFDLSAYLTDHIVAGFMMNLYVAILSLGTLIVGYRTRNVSLANYGLLLFLLLLILRFFDWNIGFLGRGIFFIVLGVVFLAFNHMFSRKLKEGEAA